MENKFYKIENELLRNELIEQIKSGYFEKLYPLIKRILPLSSSEAMDIMACWREQGFEQLIFTYYYGLLNGNPDEIRKEDLIYINSGTNQVAFDRNGFLQIIATDSIECDSYHNLGVKLLALNELTAEEIGYIYCSWKRYGYDTLFEPYGKSLLANDMDSILRIDEQFLEENRSRG